MGRGGTPGPHEAHRHPPSLSLSLVHDASIRSPRGASAAPPRAYTVEYLWCVVSLCVDLVLLSIVSAKHHHNDPLATQEGHETADRPGTGARGRAAERENKWLVSNLAHKSSYFENEPNGTASYGRGKAHTTSGSEEYTHFLKAHTGALRLVPA